MLAWGARGRLTVSEVSLLVLTTAIQVAVIPVAPSVWRARASISEIRGRSSASHDLLNSVLCSDQELLLLADDHPRAAHSHPSNQRLRLESKLVHDVEANEGAGAAQTSPTVHSHSLSSARVTLSEGDEVTDDVVLGARTIRELHLVDLDRVA